MSEPQGSPPPSTAVVPLRPEPAAPAREVRVVVDAVPMLDTARFEHMQRIATIMANTSMIPDSLRLGTVIDDKGVAKKDMPLPMATVVANCFMVVNQAVRWRMDPFAVAQCASVVYGRLMWEGKLVAAVLDANLGVRLGYEFTNADKSTPENRMLGVIVSGTIPGEKTVRTIRGTVRDWHKGDKSPWANPGAWERQLRYMGAREWARAHAPAIMLGVVVEDEMDEAIALRPAHKPRPVLPAAIPDLPDVEEDVTDTAPDKDVHEEPAKTEAEPAKEKADAKPAAASGPSSAPAKAKLATVSFSKEKSMPEPIEVIVERIEKAIESATTPGQLTAIQNKYANDISKLPTPDQADIFNAFEAKRDEL